LQQLKSKMTDIADIQTTIEAIPPEPRRKRVRDPNALTGAERMKAFRDRAKKGMRCFSLELQQSECDRLAWLFEKNRETIRAAYDSTQRQDRREIVRDATGEVRAALYAFLDLAQVGDWATTPVNNEAIKQAIAEYFQRILVPPESQRR
jgi:hypothetical protein